MGKPPSELAWWAVGFLEMYGERADLGDSDEFWDYATGAKPVPPQKLARIHEAFAAYREVLHKRLGPSRLNDMQMEQRLAISKGASDEPFFRAIRAKGYTMSSLAKELGVSKGLISHYRKGTVACPRSRAERIETLTGWKAIGRNWPGGLS